LGICIIRSKFFSVAAKSAAWFLVQGSLYYLDLAPGIEIGKSSRWLFYSLTGNWVLESGMPSAGTLQSFLISWGLNATAGNWVGGNAAWTPGSGFSLGCGLVTAQAVGTFTYGSQLH
jgi:hypothetical protein